MLYVSIVTIYQMYLLYLHILFAEYVVQHIVVTISLMVCLYMKHMKDTIKEISGKNSLLIIQHSIQFVYMYFMYVECYYYF